jgi:hypothetical protein
MISKVVLFAVLSISLAPHAWAGPGSSGGGNAVVCFDTAEIPTAIRDVNSQRYGRIYDEDLCHITSIEAYDLYLAKQTGFTQPSIIQPDPGANPMAYVEKIAKRFDAYLPAISQVLRRGKNNFPMSRISLRRDGLNRIQDEQDWAYIDRANCVIATMAAQRREGDYSYSMNRYNLKVGDVPSVLQNSTPERGLHFLDIDGRLFMHPKHSELSKAVLLLHESLYSVVRDDKGHQTSRNTREFVKAIISQVGMTVGEYQKLIETLNMPKELMCPNFYGSSGINLNKTDYFADEGYRSDGAPSNCSTVASQRIGDWGTELILPASATAQAKGFAVAAPLALKLNAWYDKYAHDPREASDYKIPFVGNTPKEIPWFESPSRQDLTLSYDLSDAQRAKAKAQKEALINAIEKAAHTPGLIDAEIAHARATLNGPIAKELQALPLLTAQQKTEIFAALNKLVSSFQLDDLYRFTTDDSLMYVYYKTEKYVSEVVVP